MTPIPSKIDPFGKENWKTELFSKYNQLISFLEEKFPKEEKMEPVEDFTGFYHKPKTLDQSSSEEWESELYKKWKNEHGDVKYGDDHIQPEWYVRNYVDTRVLPKVKELLASEYQRGLNGYGEAVIEARKEVCDEIEHNLNIYSVIAPSESRVADFTPKQFMSLITHLRDRK